MKVVDLFAGIGGFSLGLHMAGGFDTVAFVERDNYASKVLAKNFPGVPIYDDVRSYDGTEHRADIICGGYPCQPFSHAGKREGEEDDRHLWPEMLRIVAAARPRWVIAENVAGHISMGLDQVLSDLEGEGYTCQPIVIPACAVDAPHRRDRVWIVAHNDREQRGADERESNARTDRRDDSGGICKNVPDTSSGGLSGSEQEPRLTTKGNIQDKSTPTKRTQSADDCRWPPEPGVGRVANGISKRVDRLRCLGNAVVPQVVAEIGKAIMEVENENRA